MIDTIERAKDVVQEGLVELSDRLADPSLVARRRSHRRRVTTRLLLILLVASGVIAFVVAWRRRMSTRDFAPDPFGEAVEEEHAAGLLQPAAR